MTLLGTMMTVWSLTPSRIAIITSRRSYSKLWLVGLNCCGVSEGRVWADENGPLPTAIRTTVKIRNVYENNLLMMSPLFVERFLATISFEIIQYCVRKADRSLSFAGSFT